MTPQELENQSPIKVDRWVDVYSQECKDIDNTYEFTLKCLRIGLEDNFMFTDSMGRVWCKGKEEGKLYPFHFNYGKKVIGYRIAKKAAN